MCSLLSCAYTAWSCRGRSLAGEPGLAQRFAENEISFAVRPDLTHRDLRTQVFRSVIGVLLRGSGSASVSLFAVNCPCEKHSARYYRAKREAIVSLSLRVHDSA